MPFNSEIYVWLFIILVIMTLLGHGIWVFFAFLFRGSKPIDKRRPCVFCGKYVPIEANFCHWCMRDLKSPQAEEVADIDALLRQLKRFQQQGTVDAETVKAITQRAKEYREELARPSMPGLVTAAEKPVMAQAVTPFPPVDRSVVPTVKPQPLKPEPPVVVHEAKTPITAPKPESATPPAKPLVKPMAATFGIQTQQPVAPVASPSPPQTPLVPQKNLVRNLRRFFGGSQYPLDGIDRCFDGRAVDGRMFGLAGNRILEPVGKHSDAEVPDIRRLFVGRICRRIVRLSPLEIGIDRPRINGHRHIACAAEFRGHGKFL